MISDDICEPVMGKSNAQNIVPCIRNNKILSKYSSTKLC